MNRRTWLILGLVAAAALAAGTLVVVSDGGESDVAATTSTTAAPSTSTIAPSTSTTAPPLTDPIVMWPFPGSGTGFSTPTDAARTFATDFLRFTDPVVGEFQAGDSRSGEVPVRPTGNGPVTTILVRQVSGEDWSVLGAVTANIEVSDPSAFSEVSSPLRVAGRAWAYEGTVQVEVREDGRLAPIGRGFVTGGGDRPRPFQGSIEFRAPQASRGALVLFTQSADDGRVWEAAAVRIGFGAGGAAAQFGPPCGSYRPPRPAPGPGQMEVKVFFNCDAAAPEISPHAVYRLAPQSPAVLTASLEALLSGPTSEERSAPMSSWFSQETAGMLRSVVVRDGHAVVDFEDFSRIITNASTSAGSALLLSQLDATVFQFSTVQTVEYRLSGSCEAFTEWLQFGGCDPRSRPTT